MALRKIRQEKDPILRKISKTVPTVTDNVRMLAADMLETMYHSAGVGLAAPQVGILKRLIVIDVGDGPIVMINPEILHQSGEQEGQEGCLSCPGKAGLVKRPMNVKAEATNLNGEKFTVDGEALLARAICHEIDHLNGKLF
ncbi:MAG: peptide deformylase, partial [Vallitaleaceae bacterium]|nr:peptide deformylase [Vallitaleaceae bacterium]